MKPQKVIKNYSIKNAQYPSDLGCICPTRCTFREFPEFIRRVCTRHYYKSNTQKKVQEVGPRGKKKIVSKMSFSSAKSMSVTHLHLAAKLVALEGCKV